MGRCPHRSDNPSVPLRDGVRLPCPPILISGHGIDNIILWRYIKSGYQACNCISGYPERDKEPAFCRLLPLIPLIER